MDEVVGVVTDLFFQSRIAAAARAADRRVRFVGTLEDLEALPAAGLSLVDLDAAVDPLRAIELLAARGAEVVAFGPHVDTERRKAARAAGANRVLAKSKFVTELPALMGGATRTP